MESLKPHGVNFANNTVSLTFVVGTLFLLADKGCINIPVVTHEEANSMVAEQLEAAAKQHESMMERFDGQYQELRESQRVHSGKEGHPVLMNRVDTNTKEIDRLRRRGRRRQP